MENNNECNFDILNQPGIKFRHLKVQRGGAIVFDIRVVCDFESLDLKNKPLNNKGKVLSSISVGSVKNPLGLGVLEYSAIFLRYFPQYKDRLIFVTKQGIFPLGLGVLEYSAIFLRYFPQYKDRLIFVTKQGIFEQNSTAKDSNDSFHMLCAFENNILKLGSKKLLSKIAEQESQSKSEVDINVSCLNEVLHTCKSNNALTEQASVSQEQSAQVQVQGHDLSQVQAQAQVQGQKQSPADALLNSDDINLVKTNNDAQVKNKTSTGITQEVEFEQKVEAIEKVSSCSQQVSDYYDDINVLSGNCPSTRPNSTGITQEVEFEQKVEAIEKVSSCSQQVSDYYDDINVLSGNCPSTRPNLSQQTNKAQAYDLSNGSSLNELSAQNNSKHSHSSEDNHRVDSESTASKGQQATNTTATNTAATNTTRPVLRVSDRPIVSLLLLKDSKLPIPLQLTLLLLTPPDQCLELAIDL